MGPNHCVGDEEGKAIKYPVHPVSPAETRRTPTGLILISGPSASMEMFGLCHVRSTTVRDLWLVVTTVSLREPQVIVGAGSGRLSSVSRDQGQRWCGCAVPLSF